MGKLDELGRTFPAWLCKKTVQEGGKEVRTLRDPRQRQGGICWFARPYLEDWSGIFSYKRKGGKAHGRNRKKDSCFTSLVTFFGGKDPGRVRGGDHLAP